MVKLIATDMDGTFLNSSRQISPANLSAARAAIDAGIIFCLASGRGISTMDPFAAQIGTPGPMVSSNGAYVVGLDGEDVHHHSVPYEARKTIVDYALANDIHLNCYEKRKISFSKPGDFADLYVSRTGCHPDIVDLASVTDVEPTKLLYVDHPENILRYQADLTPLLAPHNISIVVSEPDYVEFLPPGINKGVGLQELCTVLCIESHEVAAIGDWWNDLEMLEWVGVSAAVENAAPEVKSIAQAIVPANDQDGFAVFVSRILAGHGQTSIATGIVDA